MIKTYTYDPKRFFIEVTFTGAFCAFIAVACTVLALRGFVPGVMWVVVVVALYTVWNTFVAHSYPRVVTISDDSVSFESFGRTDAFALSEVGEFNVREFPYAQKSYVRIDGGGLVRGRYWVRGMWFTDGQELYEALTRIDLDITPDSLKARARRSSLEARERRGK